MASEPGFKYFDIKIDLSNVEEEIVDMLLELRPQWSKKDLRTKVYTDGTDRDPIQRTCNAKIASLLRQSDVVLAQ